MIPLDQVFRRLQRPARDGARQEGKLVTLEVSGGDVRIDRAVAERLHAPLLHLVRNAVSHGIEPPAVRQKAGKHRTGIVRVCAEQRERQLWVVVADDGGGLDLAAISAKAEARGWIRRNERPDRAELSRLILRSGFSTRDDVTDLAGRGVGMDVVAREIEALKGTIDIESDDGRGTSIRLVIPLDAGESSTVRGEPADDGRAPVEALPAPPRSGG
jgi:two-component system chemotaxis sensor kinase CheA